MSLSEETKVNQTVENVVDVDLSEIRKKRFRINNDNNKILELNTSDLNVLARLEEAYPKLDTLMDEVKAIDIGEAVEQDGEVSDEAFTKAADALRIIDTKMREFVDYIFDAKVSEVCADDGSMFDPFNGKYRFEHIIDKLMGLYESNITEQFKRLEMKTAKHAAKYTKKRKK